jgi:Transposase IS200 like
VSVSRAVQYLKGKSSHKLLSEYKSLRKRYWGQHLWGRGYWVATSGKVTDEVWKKYIEDQKPEVPDDHFNVVQQVGPCGRPDPAFSRNPKPPPSGGGEFTKAVMQDRLSRVRESARRRRRPGVTCAPRLLEWRLKPRCAIPLDAAPRRTAGPLALP